MANPGLTRTFTASGAIGGRHIVKFGASDDVVTLATATVTDLQFGVSERFDVADTQRVDVIMNGIAEVVAGGNITRGNDVCADANGAAVACAPGAGTSARRVGIAMANAVAGDFVEVMILPGKVTTN